MLLQGAYSEKYRMVQQEKVNNLRDEEREEFNMKLEKTKELSRDTNRRRRALEQRRKNYEAQEEKKRREILAQRRKEIQEVTEKFQRANFVKSKRKINNNNLDYSKPNQKVKDDTIGSAVKHINTEINGQPYYPSVKEVLAMLHADQANVIERLVSGETNKRLQARSTSPVHAGDFRTGSSPHEQSPISYYSNGEMARGGEVTRETLQQHIIAQEKLRSEVVGRSQPKFAFSDETNDTMTEGVLPTTIRRDSPSGSLSSLDSLDVVPDEVPEPAGAGFASDVREGIMRKGGKPTPAYRVTFKESVIFSDGFVGVLKEKPEDEIGLEVCGMEKQKSYFDIPPEETTSNELCYSDTKTAEPSHLASVKSTPGTLGSDLTSQANRYPGVMATEMTPGTMLNLQRAAKASESMSKCTQVAAMSSHLASVKPTPAGSDLTSQPNRYPYANATEMSHVSSHARANSVSRNSAGVEDLNTSSLVRSQGPHSAAVSGGRYEYVHQTIESKSSLPSRHDLVESTRGTSNANGVSPSKRRHFGNAPMSYSEVNGFDEQAGVLHQEKTSDTSSKSAPFASINASMLKDSIEMNHDSMDGTAGSGMKHAKAIHVPTVIPSVGSTAANHVRGTSEVTHDTPLIPVTKRDFLSKALLRTSAANTAAPSSTAPSPEDSNSRSTYDDSKQSTVPSSNKTNAPYYSKTHRGNLFPNADHANEHNNNSYRQVYEHDARNNRGTQGHNGTLRGNEAKGAQMLRTVPTTNNETLLNRQDVTAQQNNRNPAYNGSPRKTIQPRVQKDTQYTATGDSYDDPLKSVQEVLERISMTSAQRGVSRAQTSTTVQGRVPSANRESRPKPVASDNGRKLAKAKNGLKVKPKDEKRSNSTAKRLHRPAVETERGIRKQTSKASVQYAATQNGIQEYSTTNPNRVQNHSSTHETNHRSEHPDSESRPIEPPLSHGHPGTSSNARKERKNSEGLVVLDKTPTDEEINTLWETVRTCLKYEKTQKAASDSIVNNVRHSRSTNGPLVGSHYLIDSNKWDPVTNAFGLNSPAASESRQGTTNVSFRRQNSLDAFERRGSGSGSTASLPPQRKASLLEHRSHKTERRLTLNQQSSRPPLNQKYFQALRGPTTSARGPHQSNTTKAEEASRPQLSYPEFQAVMQASAELQARNGEHDTQKRPHQVPHQPIIMNHRKEPSALSLEEKRLLESLDRLNERLKVQEVATAKFTNGQRKINIPGNNTSMINTTKYSQRSPNNSRFQARKKGLAKSPSPLNRR